MDKKEVGPLAWCFARLGWTIRRRKSGWRCSPSLKRSRSQAGCVVRVGDDAISTMALSILCQIGGGVTAGSTFRDAVFRASWATGLLVPECRSQRVRAGWSSGDADLSLDLEDGASGATLGLYIKRQTRPRWPPGPPVHEATGGQSEPLSAAWACCPTGAGASGMRWPLENGQRALGEKKGQSYRPPSVHGPASIARADRSLVRRGPGSRGVSDPCSARVDAPRELARPDAA
jgi:hypothetical protein